MTRKFAKTITCLTLGLTAASLAMTASAQLVEAGKPSVGFFATGPGGLQIEGETHLLSVRDAGEKVEVEVPLLGLETGISLRDRHLREHLHADRHPRARLVVQRSSLDFPADGKTTRGKATGDFWLNGQKGPLSFQYQARRKGDQYQVQALATIDIRDYGLEVPCYLKVCVQPEVRLKVKFAARDR